MTWTASKKSQMLSRHLQPCLQLPHRLKSQSPQPNKYSLLCLAWAELSASVCIKGKGPYLFAKNI